MRYLANMYNKVTSGKHVKVGGLLASFLVAALISVASVAPASAIGGCVGNSVCLYENSNFGGVKVTYNIVSVPICQNLNTQLNNQVSSVVNQTFNRIIYYNYSGCTGPYYLHDGSSSYRTNLAWDAWTGTNYHANDQISSFYVY